MAGPELQLTGERTLPGIDRENYWFQRHLVSYRHVLGALAGKSVIDVGCGEGYGPAMLGSSASKVLGVDIAPEVIEHARFTYGTGAVTFAVMDVNHLAVEDSSFDAAVSFQVVEHLADVSGYFAEIARLLQVGGTAYLTTPNRLTISPGCDKPINPFHLREYTPEEFASALEPHFRDIRIEGLFHAGWLAINERLPVVDFIKFYEMGRANPRYWTHRLLTPLVRSRDFRIGDGDLSRCLDIVATCRTASPEAR
ncbi:MAG TPA: class I SAM-dependent methyltransferase [Candidatus Anoxymicrobiaceae bacterium]